MYGRGEHWLESDLISPYARDELTPVRQDRLGLRLHRAAMAEDAVEEEEDRLQAMAHQSTTEATAPPNHAVLITTRDSVRTERRPTCRDLPTCRRRRRLRCRPGHPWVDRREEEGELSLIHI